jgi:hypothetical protein
MTGTGIAMRPEPDLTRQLAISPTAAGTTRVLPQNASMTATATVVGIAASRTGPCSMRAAAIMAPR